MTRRNIVILLIVYVMFMVGLFWLATSPAVHAVMVSAEVVAPEPVLIAPSEPEVVDSYERGIPGTWNPQTTIKAESQ
jgi:hypothetical protein